MQSSQSPTNAADAPDRVLSDIVDYALDYADPLKRSNTTCVSVGFDHGSSTPAVTIEYPLGHKRRREEALPALRDKLATSLSRRFTRGQQQRILALCDDADAFERTPVNAFVDLLVP